MSLTPTERAIRRFDTGGVLVIVSGATSFEVADVEPDSIQFTPPSHTLINRDDRGTILVDKAGNPIPGEFSYSGRLSGYAAANDIAGQFTNIINADTGLAKTFTIKLWIPNHLGATNGELITMNSCHLTGPITATGGGPPSADDRYSVVFRIAGSVTYAGNQAKPTS